MKISSEKMRELINDKLDDCTSTGERTAYKEALGLVEALEMQEEARQRAIELLRGEGADRSDVPMCHRVDEFQLYLIWTKDGDREPSLRGIFTDLNLAYGANSILKEHYKNEGRTHMEVMRVDFSKANHIWGFELFEPQSRYKFLSKLEEARNERSEELKKEESLELG